jgi:hypothetical protein
MHDCGLTPAAGPALARLVAGGALTKLHLCNDNDNDDLLDEASAVLLGNALRANTSLTALTGSLTGHPSLRALDMFWNCGADDGVVEAMTGAALAALLLANAPALQTLDIGSCGLGDGGMRPVVEALRHNTHLTKLRCGENDVSEAFAREHIAA